MSYGKPQPQRFEVYTLISNQKGFTINNCKFIFKFDRYGGWKDEYGNYYNADGQPDEQPQDAQLTPSQASINSDYQENQYDKIYGADCDYENQQEDQGHIYAKNYQKISKNLQTLQQYPANKQLRVYFSNASYRISNKQMYNHYSKKVGGIINIILQEQNKKKNGNGYFVLENVDYAEILIKLQGQKITQRQLYFQVSDVQQFVLDPLTPQQLVNIFPKENNIPKFMPSPPEKKTQKKQQKKIQTKEKEIVQKKQQKSKQQKNKQQKSKQDEQKKTKPKYHPKQEVIEKVKEQEKKKIDEKVTKIQEKKQKHQFSRYILNFEIFSTKTRFVNWMQKYQAKRDEDYKNIDKKQGSEKTIISMEVRNSIVQKLKGQKYQGKQVIFTLI